MLSPGTLSSCESKTAEHRVHPVYLQEGMLISKDPTSLKQSHCKPPLEFLTESEEPTRRASKGGTVCGTGRDGILCHAYDMLAQTCYFAFPEV